MNPTIKFDASGFKRAARRLYETSSRSVSDFTNGQALKVAIEAIRRTSKANAAEIRTVLGQIGSGVAFKARKRDTKAGKKGSYRTVKTGAVIAGNSFAERILAKRFRLSGKWAVAGNTMEERVRNLIAARVKSATFIASGWLPARRLLFAAVRQKPPGINLSFAGATQYGKEKGSAKLASPNGIFGIITAEITNSALLDKPNVPAPPPGGDPMPVATKGLQAALDETERDMIETLERRLKPDFDRFNEGH